MVTADVEDELALACRILASEGLGDFVCGHASARGDDPGTFWLKGAELGMEEIGRDDLVLLDLDGNVLAGKRPRHLEWPIHAEILRARPDVRSVVHAHAPATVALGCTDVDLAPLCHEAIRWMPPPPRFTESSALIDTPDLGRAVAERMGSGAGFLLRNHGFVAAGGSVRAAAIMSIFLDRACQTQLTTMATGVHYHAASPADEQLSRVVDEARSRGGVLLSDRFLLSYVVPFL